MPATEIYVAARSRSLTDAVAFLNRFLPDRVEQTDEYFIPQHADSPQMEFDEVCDLMMHLEHATSEDYNLYWRQSALGPIEHAMLLYTEDGGLICGLAPNSGTASAVLSEMKTFLCSVWGYATEDELPPALIEDFRTLCLRRGTRDPVSAPN